MRSSSKYRIWLIQPAIAPTTTHRHICIHRAPHRQHSLPVWQSWGRCSRSCIVLPRPERGTGYQWQEQPQAAPQVGPHRPRGPGCIRRFERRLGWRSSCPHDPSGSCWGNRSNDHHRPGTIISRREVWKNNCCFLEEKNTIYWNIPSMWWIFSLRGS